MTRILRVLCAAASLSCSAMPAVAACDCVPAASPGAGRDWSDDLIENLQWIRADRLGGVHALVSGRSDSSARLISSLDGGQTWSEPLPLPLDASSDSTFTIK